MKMFKTYSLMLSWAIPVNTRTIKQPFKNFITSLWIKIFDYLKIRQLKESYWLLLPVAFSHGRHCIGSTDDILI